MLNRLKTKTYRLLRWSEKYTKTDMVYLASGGFWLSAGSIISSIASFVLAIAYANFLSPETYGTYKYILSISSLLAITSLPGMRVALTRSIAKGYDGTVFLALKAKIKWGAIGSFVGLIIATYYYFNNNNTLALTYLIISFFVPLLNSLSIYQTYLNGKKLFKFSSIINSVNRIVSISILILVIFLTDNLIYIVLAYFLSNTLLRLILLIFSLKKHKPNKEQDDSVISYAKHLTVINVISLFAGQLDKLLIWHYLGPVELAIYIFALAPVDQIKSLFKSIIPLALPKFATQNKETLKKYLPKKILNLSIITACSGLLFIILVPFLFELFFPAYMSSIFYSRLYALTLIFYPSLLFVTALNSQKDKNKLYIYNFTTAPIKITLLYILISSLGLNGVFIAILLHQITSILLLRYLFNK